MSSTLTNACCICGIDIGTGTSSIVINTNRGDFEIVGDSYSHWIKSIVCFLDNINPPLIGEDAENESKNDPKQVIFDIKRMLGRRYKDSYIQKLKSKWPFEIIEDSSPEYFGEILVITKAGPKRPHQLIAEIIKYLLEIANEVSAGNTITHAVISVPANYSTRQRELTQKAAFEAGLKVVNLIAEPTAGVLYYWYKNYQKNCYNVKEEGYVLIYDIGTGTTDISVAYLKDNNIQIKAVDGEMWMGGRDVDNNLLDYYINQKLLRERLNADLIDSNNSKIARKDFQIIRKECQRAKEQLSGRILNVEIDPSIMHRLDKTSLELSLDKFEEINKSLFENLLPPIDRVLTTAHITKHQIKAVILIGGSSSLKIVQSKLRQYFGKQPYKDGEPRNFVVMGAAIDARRRYVDNKNCCKELLNLKYIDVCPLSIGIELLGEKIQVMIPRNTKLPINEVSEIFTTASNFQKKLDFLIHETEKPIASQDTLIGKISINIPSAQAGEIKVKLTLSLDENCILTAKAQVVGHFITETKVIRQGSNMNESYINNMISMAQNSKFIDDRKALQQFLEQRWKCLHNNVILFIDEYGKYVIKNVKSINNAFNEIKNIANREKNNKVLSEDHLNRAIADYKERFAEYNKYAPPNQKTNFLNNA